MLMIPGATLCGRQTSLVVMLSGGVQGITQTAE